MIATGDQRIKGLRGDVKKGMVDEEVGMEVRQRKDFCSRRSRKKMEDTA